MLILILLAAIGGAVAGYHFHDQIVALVQKVKNLI